jgi:hypothetical protein
MDTMKAVAQDILFIKINKSATIGSLMKKFLEIMNKHGIKYGTRSRDGVSASVANFEWTMCKALFIDTLCTHMKMKMMMDHMVDFDMHDDNWYRNE